MKKRLLVSSLLLAGMVVMGAGRSLAYEAGDTDPSKPEGSNTQVIKRQGSADIVANGWIGTFDPTLPIEPEKPTPPPTGDDWINVTVPKKILFGSLASNQGAVFGPNYKILNNSVKDVKVSVNEMKLMTGSDSKITDKLTLNLKMDAVTVPLVTEGGILLKTPTDLATITTKKDKTFTLNGTFTGIYPEVGAASTPEYTMTLGFKVV